MSTVAIITARGGSKGILNKNLVLLAGKALIQYTIDAAQTSEVFDEIIVSSDCSRILDYASSVGINTIERPAELAQDLSPTEPVITHCIQTLQSQGKHFEHIALLQPTSPMRNARHIREAKALYDELNADMIVSVIEANSHPMKAYKVDDEGNLTGAFGPDFPYRPRQSLPTCYYANGAIYIFGREDFESRESFPKENIKPYVMSTADSTDIDTPADLAHAEKILQSKN